VLIRIDGSAGLPARGEIAMSLPFLYPFAFTQSQPCGTGLGFTFQMSIAYSAVVRSMRDFPEPATRFQLQLKSLNIRLVYCQVYSSRPNLK
jgi:hypothetical protein